MLFAYIGPRVGPFSTGAWTAWDWCRVGASGFLLMTALTLMAHWSGASPQPT